MLGLASHLLVDVINMPPIFFRIFILQKDFTQFFAEWVYQRGWPVPCAARTAVTVELNLIRWRMANLSANALR